MKLFSTILFVAAFLVWAVLEFGLRDQYEGIKDILFWVGMTALLLGGMERGARQSA